MYSMVLMVAMSTSPEAAACHKSACSGCSCSGVVVVDSCNGCSGKHGGLFAGKGCCGGGLFAGKGCCGGGLFAGKGCCGGGLFGKHKHSCNGSMCCGGAVEGCSGTIVVPATPAPEEKKVMPKDPKGGVTFAPVAPAYITVNVPADAKVTIDGNNTVSTATVRRYATPALSTGTVHYYTFAAEVVREGKVFSTTEKVAVEAGANVEITLNPNVGPAVASK